MMTGPTPKRKLKRLSSGYWHYRFSANQFAQWPVHRNCTKDDFIEPLRASAKMVDECNDAVSAHNMVADMYGEIGDCDVP